MPVPSQPTSYIPRPFAASGSRTLIPDTTTSSGRASYTSGFPTETQLPLRSGGVAPNRTDFNGLFNLLTAFGFWQQSGGMWTYNASLNYKVPCLVYWNTLLWWCVKENGPDSANGVVTPGSNEAYWLEFLTAIGGAKEIPDPTPVGTVIMYAATTPPDGYFACNGASFSASTYPSLYKVLGSSILPDMRGYFVRGYDTRNTVDPDGASRAIRSTQSDAIRNITGRTGYVTTQWDYLEASSGALSSSNIGGSHQFSSGDGLQAASIFIDASRVVPTAEENRPKNMTMLYCIKHD